MRTLSEITGTNWRRQNGMIRSIIFDLDGTLLDRNSSIYLFIVDQYERIIKMTKNIDKKRYINRFIELDNRGYVWKDRVYQELIKEFDLSLDWNELLTDYKNGFCNHAIRWYEGDLEGRYFL